MLGRLWSRACGVGSSRISTDICNNGLPLPALLLLFWREVTVVGVGNKPPPIALMAGSHSTRRYTCPLRIKPCRGQLSENSVQSVSKDRCDVLHDDVARSNCANDTHEFVKETAPSALLDAGLLACGADVLAGKSTANNVSCSLLGKEGGDVAMDGCVGKVLGKDLLAVGLPFNELNGPEATEPASCK